MDETTTQPVQESPWLIYGDGSGRSGVQAYREGPDFIEVRFKDGSVYLYTNESAGKSTIAYMKRVANYGHGLNGFINFHVKKKYARKG